VYPDIKQFETNKPPNKNRGYWQDPINQRAFFDQLAVKFNIQDPKDWYNITRRQVMKEGGFFMKYYNSSTMQGTLC
jgi:hypothetical protein